MVYARDTLGRYGHTNRVAIKIVPRHVYECAVREAQVAQGALSLSLYTSRMRGLCFLGKLAMKAVITIIIVVIVTILSVDGLPRSFALLSTCPLSPPGFPTRSFGAATSST